MEYKIILVLTQKPEKYDVKISVYDEAGKLISEKEYENIKQIVVKNSEVLISAQLAPTPTVITILTEKPEINYRHNRLIIGE
ncbi:MAG: hypothetical protein DRO40_02505 [Thermoprotei archaeon]|nr:MAG: hypothetical protein DRO40_02505 [Thermoprotei archaeon]